MSKSTAKLTGKDQSAFKTALKLFDSKSYKKALKSIDKILATNAQHADSVALKGLILYESGEKEEGRRMSKQGLALGKSSFFVWDVRAKILEADGDLAEAATAMKMALLVEKDTDRSRDMRIKLSVAQFTNQDYTGFLESRVAILASGPDEARSWPPCAIAAQFMGDYETALAMNDRYTTSVRSDLPPHELSELLFYQAELLAESGDAAGAVALLDKEEGHLVEKRRWREQKTRLLLELGGEERLAEAAKLADQLLQINSEDSRYQQWLVQARGIQDNVDALYKLYVEELQPRFPRSAASKRAPLDFLPASDERFRTCFAAYYQPLLEKGAPSAFGSLKSLYADKDKVAVIEKLLLADLAELRRDSRFAGDDERANPSTVVWALYFAAQHFDKLAQWTEALKLVDEAIRHTPTLIDLYTVKARIAKHVGDLETAYALSDRARVLDTADRWLNAKCVQYALTADKIAEADVRMGIFARAEDGMNNVFDMQNQRYMLALGLSHLRLGDTGKGLKVLRHFLEVYREFVNNHAELLRFSMAANTVSAWASMGRWLLEARTNPNFVRAITACVHTYLTLYIQSGKADAPAEPTEAELEEQWAAMSPKTRKAAKQAHRRAEKAKEEEEKKSRPATRSQAQRSVLFIKGDPDPVGELLLQQDPLEEAHRLVQVLVKGAPQLVEAQSLAGRVAVYRNKLVQALAALKKAHTLAPNDPLTHQLAVEILAATKLQAGASPAVSAALEAARPTLLQGCKTAAEYIESKWTVSSVEQVAALAEMELRVLKRPLQAAVLEKVSIEPHSVQACAALLRLLEREKQDALAAAWKKHCSGRFSGPVFGGQPVAAPELVVEANEAPAPAAE